MFQSSLQHGIQEHLSASKDTTYYYRVWGKPNHNVISVIIQVNDLLLIYRVELYLY